MTLLKEVINIFTGLIQEIGTIKSVKEEKLGLTLSVSCKEILKDIKIGDSVATNGVCLTVINFGKTYFSANIMYETYKRSNLKNLKIGDSVNLETSLTLNTKLGGHLVTGDVDCEAQITEITTVGIAKVYKFHIDKKYAKYIVEKGRITIDGASLTVVDTNDTYFSISLIPHSLENLILKNKKIGDMVNIETDLIAKHIEKLILNDNSENAKTALSMEFLQKNGF